MAVNAVDAPLLETKLRPPAPRPGLVARARLHRRLDEAADRPLTLVSAPAGWGKSTLVGEWLSARGTPAAWLLVDPADNDPARFWRYVVEAVRRAGADVDPQSVGALAAGGDTFEAGLSALLNAAARLPRTTVLALDDYHLIEDPVVHGSVAFAVEHLPERLRVLMASRTDPPIGVPRLRARGELAEVRADDLRFDEEEAEALLRAATGRDLGPDHAARLRRRTEGWGAGLYLAGLSLRHRDDAERFIADFAGDDRLVVDYLASEVLEGQPPERREFMLRTSVLGRLSGPLCDAVTGIEGSARLLEELERSNLFLVPLDSRREWFRYHHLFGELLQHELALAAPDEAAELHRRAALWHRDNGDPDDAIHHFAAAGDLDAAADMVALHWPGHLRAGFTGTAQRWLGMLPHERVIADPRLCLAGAWTELNLGRPRDASRWIEAARVAHAERGQDPAADGSLLAARSIERLLSGDVAEALSAGRAAVDLVRDPFSWVRAAACLALGIALHGSGDLPAARPVLEEAVDVGRRTGSWAPAVVALCHLVEHDLIAGDLAAAEDRAREALAFAADESHAEYPHAAGAHSGLARILAAHGDLEGASREADRALELARRGRAPTEIAHCCLVRGEIALLRGDVDTARASAREMRDLLGSAEGMTEMSARLRALEEGSAAGPRPAPDGEVAELTPRERDVLAMLAGAASVREIAASLYVSHNTVKTQIRSIYRKLGVRNRSEAVAVARERRLSARARG